MRQKYKGDDIRGRLHGTIIRFKGHPYMCEVDATGSIGLLDIVKGDLVARVEPDDLNLDISSLPLGYINIPQGGNKGVAVYVKREPLRRYKQGVEVGYLSQKALNSEGAVNIRSLQCQGLVDCVLEKYPTFKSALDMIGKGWTSVAITRHIALKRNGVNIEVYFKENEAGSMRLGTTLVNIPKSDISWCVKEELEVIKDWTVVEV